MSLAWKKAAEGISEGYRDTDGADAFLVPLKWSGQMNLLEMTG